MAADLWAAARKAGKPTASDTAIEGEVILAAPGHYTRRPVVRYRDDECSHLARFVPAEEWKAFAS